MTYKKPKCKKCKQDLKFIFYSDMFQTAIYVCENCLIKYEFGLKNGDECNN